MKRLLAALLFPLTACRRFAGCGRSTPSSFRRSRRSLTTFGGYLEFRPILFGLDKNASLYKLNLFDKERGGHDHAIQRRLWIDANVQKGIAGFYLQMNTDYPQSEVVDATSKTKPYQAYLSLKPIVVTDDRCREKDVQVGQRAMRGTRRPSSTGRRTPTTRSLPSKDTTIAIGRLHQELFLRPPEDLLLHARPAARLRRHQ